MSDSITILEQDTHKTVMMVPKGQSGQVLGELMKKYTVRDITVVEEDIGNIVERIYATGENCI